MTTSTHTSAHTSTSRNIVIERNNWRKTHINNLFGALLKGEEGTVGVLKMVAFKPSDFGYSTHDLKYYDSFYAQKEENLQGKIEDIQKEIRKINSRLGDGAGVSKGVIEKRNSLLFISRSIQKKRDVVSKMRELLNEEILRRQVRMDAAKAPQA